MRTIKRPKPSSHDREIERKPAVCGYDLHVCRAYLFLATGETERSTVRLLAAEMSVMPSEVADAVSHAAECHRALSGLLGRPNGTKAGASSGSQRSVA
jgi:hypothetical protein